MELEQIDIHKQKKKNYHLDADPILSIAINSKWIKNLNPKFKIVKFLESNEKTTTDLEKSFVAHILDKGLVSKINTHTHTNS